MASRQFEDGAAVTLRATGEAATVIRLLPQNGIDPTNYYEIRRAGSTLGEGAAEGLLVATPTATPAATPAGLDAPVAPPEGQQAALVAEAEHLLQEATQGATEAPAGTEAPAAVPETPPDGEKRR